jgi:Spy/CpxP family protein refolding chaperone
MKYFKGDDSMKKRFVIAVALMLAAFPLLRAADNPGHDSDEGTGPGMAIGDVFRFTEELKLAPDQEEKIQAMRESSKRELFALRNDLLTTVWDIHDEFSKDTPDKAKINSLTDKMADIEKKLIKTRTGQMFKVKEILTAEQFKKFISLLEKHKDRIQKKMLERMKKAGRSGPSFS